MPADFNRSFSGSKVLVCGIARSGHAAAKMLQLGGARVTVTDVQSMEDLSAAKRAYADELSALGIRLVLGKQPDDIIGLFHYIVISPGIPIDSAFIIKAREIGVPVIGELELGYMACRASIAAITGTNGKTTATTITGNIFKRNWPGSETLGNIGTAFCEKAADIPENAWAALEVSSFMLESVKTFRPRIAAVLNISEDHLNRHYTMEQYIGMKERVFLNQCEQDALVLNYDDPVCRKMAQKAVSAPAYFSASGEPAGRNTMDKHCVFKSGGDIMYRYMNHYERLWDAARMRTPFAHILEDAMAAALIGIIAGADKGTIRECVTEFAGVEHRVEFIGAYNGVEFYNDSKATNVDAACKALTAVNGRVVLIGGGMDKKTDFTPWVKHFREKVKHLIVFGETACQITALCDIIGFNNYERVSGLKEAVAAAKRVSRQGDRVLLSPACASFDMFESYEERGRLFTEYVLEV